MSLMVANGLLRVCTYMLITVVPLYALARGVSPAGAGLTTTFYMAAAVVVRPLSGRLVDSRGRYAVMLFGSLLYCAATGLYALTLPVWLLLAVRAPLKKVAARHHRPSAPTPTARLPAFPRSPASPTPAAAPGSATPGGRARQPWWSRLVDENVVRPAVVMFFVMSGVAGVAGTGSVFVAAAGVVGASAVAFLVLRSRGLLG